MPDHVVEYLLESTFHGEDSEWQSLDAEAMAGRRRLVDANDVGTEGEEDAEDVPEAGAIHLQKKEKNSFFMLTPKDRQPPLSLGMPEQQA